MRRGRHLALTILAASGAATSLYQCWYVCLPIERAATFDLCRLTPVLDCLRSLHAFGGDMLALGMPVLPLLAGLFLFQSALCGFAWLAGGARRDAWLALAGLASFPASGLALFVLLNDVLVARATSLSAVLVAIASLGISTLAVLEGLKGIRLRHGARGALAMALMALAAGSFLAGAVSSRRAVLRIQADLAVKPPALRWASFAHDLPRAGAATLGLPRAPTEVILILDPEEPRSRDLMRQAAELMPRHEEEILLTLYAAGEAGARLMLAQREGRLAAYLRGAEEPQGQTAPLRPLVEWQEEAWRGLGVRPEDLPVALWRSGRAQGEISLERVLESARASAR